ncbi:hypothetical protein GCM10010329_30010 [Streptomyces spiroverticillatus]|uniref:DUF6314 domain-containing protein n=1 Tax=Streptomyces finlayi TaxID=67296 RepID=A0A919C9I1_9ACTN|nr:DUF6314 family protein [Streptomyces finlayi]GHA05551.1 hypothetical protein GCM10010329_30010 [Streptomyces spiroverticillatus]GHC89402.1 hypothetical protein GCM10010334_22420 [Streptomyces finlayi]
MPHGRTPDSPAHHRPHPVADAAAYLAGGWSVERGVRDLALGVEGRFVGTADFREGEGSGGVLSHEEEGRLDWDGRTFPSSRTLRLCPRGDGTAEVEFADGRPFHDLDLREGSWHAVHPCAADRYEGTFTVRSADEWHLEWRVTGPAKDQSLRSVYRRRADG